MPKGLCRLACAGNKVDRCAVAAIACGAWPRWHAGRNLDLCLMQNAAICRRKSLRCNGLRRFWASGCLFNESSEHEGGPDSWRWPWFGVVLACCGLTAGHGSRQRGVHADPLRLWRPACGHDGAGREIVRRETGVCCCVHAFALLWSAHKKIPAGATLLGCISCLRSESRATARPRSRSAR